jgi:hypothetical protein
MTGFDGRGMTAACSLSALPGAHGWQAPALASACCGGRRLQASSNFILSPQDLAIQQGIFISKTVALLLARL